MRAPLCLHAGHWKAAAEAVATIASWRRIPAPLAWMVEARLHLVGVQATWPMLAELAWLSPRRLDDRARRSPDPLFAQWIRRFEASFEGAGDAGDRACTCAAWSDLTGPPMEANRQPRSNGTPVCTNVVYSRRRALHRTIGGMRAIRGPCRERCGLFFTHITGVFPCMA